MRIRDMGFEDYGINPKEAERLKRLCRDLSNREVQDKLHAAAFEANPGIACLLMASLRFAWSYEVIDAKRYMPISSVDFYAYRRRTLAIFRDKLSE